MELATAVRISMSIPLFFAAVRHGSRQDVYVDGGVQLNEGMKADQSPPHRREDRRGLSHGELVRRNPHLSVYGDQCVLALLHEPVARLA